MSFPHLPLTVPEIPVKLILFACVAAVAVWFFVLRPEVAQQQAADDRGSAAVAEAAEEAAKETHEIIRERNETVREITRTTENSSNDIQNAPGADDPIDPDLHQRGLDALCLRDGLQDHPACQ